MQPTGPHSGQSATGAAERKSNDGVPQTRPWWARVIGWRAAVFDLLELTKLSDHAVQPPCEGDD